MLVVKEGLGKIESEITPRNPPLSPYRSLIYQSLLGNSFVTCISRNTPALSLIEGQPAASCQLYNLA